MPSRGRPRRCPQATTLKASELPGESTSDAEQGFLASVQAVAKPSLLRDRRYDPVRYHRPHECPESRWSVMCSPVLGRSLFSSAPRVVPTLAPALARQVSASLSFRWCGDETEQVVIDEAAEHVGNRWLSCRSSRARARGPSGGMARCQDWKPCRDRDGWRLGISASPHQERESGLAHPRAHALARRRAFTR